MAGYLPSRESELINWFANFKTQIAGDPAVFGLSLEQGAGFIAAIDAYAAAYAVANDASTRTKSAVQAKNTAKKAAVALARQTVAICQAWPGMTDAKRDLLKISIRDGEPTVVGVPSSAPIIEIESVVGYTIKLNLQNADREGRAKPAGVAGATLFSYVGESAPTDIGAWKFEGSVTTIKNLSITVPGTVAAGSKVFLTSFWFNRKSESGPATMPVSTHIQGGGLSQAA